MLLQGQLRLFLFECELLLDLPITDRKKFWIKLLCSAKTLSLDINRVCKTFLQQTFHSFQTLHTFISEAKSRDTFYSAERVKTKSNDNNFSATFGGEGSKADVQL